jgi:hypothetical protein
MANLSTFNWIVEKLANNENVGSTNIINESILNIVRKEGESLTVSLTTLESFTISDIKEISDRYNTDFILHTFREPFVNGAVFDYLESKEKTLGGFGDLFRVIDQGFNWPFLTPEVRFIKRGLEQHTKVSDVRRLDNKRYEISRNGLEAVIIIALNDYDLGVDSIREAVDKYQKFDAVLKSNPNGRISTDAITLADSREIKVFKWGELLRQLNFKWKWIQ